jgi:Heparinase II/III-like protein/Heparinase II/III N-terminus
VCEVSAAAAGIGTDLLDEIRTLGFSAELRRLELPEVKVIGPRRTRRPTRRAMLGDLFYVYGQQVRLAPPIDWRQDPHGNRTWRYELHTLTWLKEALARHAAASDVGLLAVARDAVLDWARAHLRAEGEQSEFAWYDMAVGLRAPYVGYVLRACLAEDMLDGEQADLLLEAAERHGAELAAGDNYAAGNNHGLFQDEGLYLLARQLPPLPAAAAWRELALTRMRGTLEATVSFADGAHLEHSPAYQLAILELVARLARSVSELPELGDLLDRMRRTAAWQVTPSGRMAQLGDTDDLPAPGWMRDTASSLRGANALFEAGQAIVREGDSYLAVSAGHHGPGHKHADDGGLLLIEDGQVVLGDAGRWGYYETEPDRVHARSAAAHNVLTVDGRDFEWRRAAPYGSGLEAIGEGDGWHAIVVRNPLLSRQGVEHRRVVLYRPARALIVVDDLRSTEQHEYARHFHFGPELEAEQDSRGRVALTGAEVTATLVDLGEGGEGRSTLELHRGREDPRLGWTYPADREREETWTAVLRSRAADATFAAALTLGEEPIEVSEIEVAPQHVALTLAADRRLEVRLDGRSALVALRQAR